MSTERPAGVMVRDLIDEAKKRIVFLIVSLVGLSYLMSLTSSSVLVNLPAAAVLIVIVRYLSLDFDMRKKAAVYKSKSSSFNDVPQKMASRSPNLIIERSDWRRKVNSPVVEDAIDKFTRHMVSEWITDMWYSKITPDRQAPEELVQIMNGVLGEISCRMRNINLIDLLTRDIIHLLCSHLELFQATKAKIDKQHSRSLSIEELDKEIKFALSADNKLHPSLFSVEAEHKVLQHIMEGLISLTFKPEDLHCSFFRYIVRELLACAVMRPVLNLASPRFINERIESVVVSVAKTEKGTTKPEVESTPKPNGSMKVASNHISHFLDPSSKGVELVELKKDQLKGDGEKHETGKENGTIPSKDPLLCMETQSTRSWSSLPSETNGGDGNRHRSGEEWGDMLDVFSRRKTEALAPEHFDNMWTKGRNYKSKGATDQSTASIQGSLVGTSKVLNSNKDFSKQKETGEIKDAVYNEQSITNKLTSHGERNSIHSSVSSSILEDIHEIMDLDEVESGNDGSFTTEDDEANNITGLNSPGVRVWDGKNRKNVTTIHHPLESIDGHKTRKARKGHARAQKVARIQSGRKRSRTPQKGDVWQEVERTSFLVGDGKDILNSSKGRVKDEDSSEDSGAEMYSTISRGSSISSSLSSNSLPGSNNLVAYSSKSPVISDSFLTLRCEMLGANIVKSGSKSFAVYSISVTDMNNHSWSIKRRFRHFEELHRRLKEFPEYNLHLPPKHFLSTGVDVPVIQERCKLLDNYLKRLMNIHTVCSSIEVWDFLSVDSQTYIFSNSLSIIETLPVNLDNTSRERRKGYQNNTGSQRDSQSLRSSSHLKSENADFILQTKSNVTSTRSQSNSKTSLSSPKTTVKETVRSLDGSSSGSDRETQKVSMSSKSIEKTHNTNDVLHASFDLPTDTGYDPTIPSEWVPPNLSLPIFDLVDVIFQLQDGGWIRRNAFWVAKQVLQLGMGDAFDDWLIEKIQLLRKGSVVASGIGRIEQILWPDGIFITKHPRNHKPTVSSSTPPNASNGPPTPVSSPKIEKLDDSQVREAERRAKLVYELMIDRAPAAVVGLVGRKEYEQCAKYLYYFIQSSVVMKQLAYDILELILSSAFPELSDVFKELHEEKEKFGKLS